MIDWLLSARPRRATIISARNFISRFSPDFILTAAAGEYRYACQFNKTALAIYTHNCRFLNFAEVAIARDIFRRGAISNALDSPLLRHFRHYSLTISFRRGRSALFDSRCCKIYRALLKPGPALRRDLPYRHAVVPEPAA